MDRQYIPRTVDGTLQDYLELRGAVLVEGPKWCGKTRTAEQFSRSAFYIRNAARANAVRNAVEAGSRFYLDGESPHLIDEWQNVPEIWDEIKFEVDHNPDRRYILTGSAVPPRGSVLHSGAGRINTVKMGTMSLFESGESNGQVSLRGLFDGDRVSANSELDLDATVHAIVRGGWPVAVMDDGPRSYVHAQSYVANIVEHDMSRMFEGILYEDESDPEEESIHVRGSGPGPSETGDGRRSGVIREVTGRAMRSIAKNLATSASVAAILRDVNAEKAIVSAPTFNKYLSFMNRMFITENLGGWNPHIRSSTALVTKPKWHFCDPSIAAAVLGVSETRLKEDPNALGYYFESMCLRDIRSYLQPLDGQVYYIGNVKGYEVDFIVELRDGRWGAFEVRLGSTEHEKAASNLLKLREMVDTSEVGDPSFLAVLTGTPYGMTRKDGVHIVPVGSLAP